MILNTITTYESFFQSFENAFNDITFFVPNIIKPVFLVFVGILILYATKKVLTFFITL